MNLNEVNRTLGNVQVNPEQKNLQLFYKLIYLSF